MKTSQIEDALWDFDPFQPPPPRIGWIKRGQDNIDTNISRRRHERTGGGNRNKISVENEWSFKNIPLIS
jgi:hypothetical protein